MEISIFYQIYAFNNFLNFSYLFLDFAINMSGGGSGKNTKLFSIPCNELGQLMFEVFLL